MHCQLTLTQHTCNSAFQSSPVQSSLVNSGLVLVPTDRTILITYATSDASAPQWCDSGRGADYVHYVHYVHNGGVRTRG